jgi:hypothetical protein
MLLLEIRFFKSAKGGNVVFFVRHVLRKTFDFSEGSVMERHHFAQSMCVLNTEGCNILENITKQVKTVYLKGLSRELDWDFDDRNG